MGTLIDLTGRKIGRLTVLKRVGSDKNKKTLWLCRCECGNEKVICSNTLLRKNKTLSCGCLAKEILINRNTTHNLTKESRRLYKIWANMKSRCYNPKSNSFKYYGQRGIYICREWKDDFSNFYNWAINNGYESDLTIERIDVNDIYKPSNCKWINRSEQNLNKRNNRMITFKGETKPLNIWCNELNLNRGVIRTRLKLGWSVEKAFTVPSIKGRNQYYKE